jgi:hypothetical protein
MIPPDALQVILITHAKSAVHDDVEDCAAEEGDYPRPKDIVETIRTSFIRLETNELVRELSLVDEQGTGASVRCFYVDSTDGTKPVPPPAAELEQALHTLVVLLLTEALVNDAPVLECLEEMAHAVKNSRKRDSFIVLGTSEGVLAAFAARAESGCTEAAPRVERGKAGRVRGAAGLRGDPGASQGTSIIGPRPRPAWWHVRQGSVLRQPCKARWLTPGPFALPHYQPISVAGLFLRRKRHPIGRGLQGGAGTRRA